MRVPGSPWSRLKNPREQYRVLTVRDRDRASVSSRPFSILSGQREEARILCNFDVPSILHLGNAHRWQAFPIQDKVKGQDPGVSLHSGSTVVQASRECTSFLLLSRSSLTACQTTVWHDTSHFASLKSQKPTGVTLSYLTEMLLNLSGLSTV